MNIKSLNVGKPETIEYKGEQVLTGIDKRPVEGPRLVRKLNIDGDGQADPTVHGGIDKAVYAFPVEHYDYYRDALRAGGEYPPGQFGENLTTGGLLENEVRIGDRYRVGEVLFEVSQPRSPCYKFAIRMGAAEALSVCIESARTGFYLRVLEEGMLQAGDSVTAEYVNRNAPSVEQVHLLYYRDRHNLEALRQAVACESLAGEFKDDFEKRLAKLEKQH